MNKVLEQAIHDEGLAIFQARDRKANLFQKDHWLGRMMDWVMKDPSFKVDLFRFVDVLPMLVDKDQVAKHIDEYLLKKDRKIPFLMNTALKAASLSLARGIAASAIKKNVIEMAKRFIAGVDIDDARDALTGLEARGFSFTIDLLGEKTLSDEEADQYLERYHRLIKTLPKALVDPNVSVKVSALSCRIHEEAPSDSVLDIERRILPLLRLAQQNGVFVNFDVEDFASHGIVYRLFKKLALDPEFRSWPRLGIVVQAYLIDAKAHLQELVDVAKTRGCPITVRLVKGAYWDYQVVRAQQLGHRTPVHVERVRTDANYEELSKVLLDNASVIRAAFASHNVRSLAHAIAYAKSKNLDQKSYEIQMLYGMAESDGAGLIERGHDVRIYAPLGDLLPGMAYLVRRLLENTSQMGFVRLSQQAEENQDVLLKKPIIEESRAKSEDKAPGFINAGQADFTREEVGRDFTTALENVRRSLPFDIPIIIDGKVLHSDNKMSRHCPADHELIISQLSLATNEHADLAVKACAQAINDLNSLGLLKRIEHLNNLADVLTEERFWLASLIIFEVGKSWAESYADVGEAIDFCRYYAEQAPLEIKEKKIGDISGEENFLRYQGRGPTVVIAPWNFPLAILCGMSVAAYVAGNPIILKPAEQSSAIAHALYERMIKASFLKSAVQFVPGIGEQVGKHLVSHKDVANICFTGSMKVGHEIIKLANTVAPDQRQMKRVICEMGGKNAIIVDDDADLDEAISGVIHSSFMYAGQKCSAASRVLPIGTVADQFIERLVLAVKSLRIGSPIDPSNYMGPVIDQEAHVRLLKAIKDIKQDNSLRVLFIHDPMDGGYFVPPMVVEVFDEMHWLMQEELFGPILAVHRCSDLVNAVRIANGTRFALTGAIFSRSPNNITYARENFSVGNLYINQKCSGALVGRQPFGGFKMSGTGVKAGGPNYLHNFVDTKVVTENTMRKGFTPEVSV